MFHSGQDCNHSYSDIANHSFMPLCNASYMSESMGNKLKRLRKAANMTQQEVADAICISRVAVSKWESGQTKDLKHENLRGIAKLFRISLEELLSGTAASAGSIQEPSKVTCLPGWSNVRPGPDVVGLIPLISWVQAGAFCAAVNVLEPGDAERWIPTLKQYGPHAYALRVQGDSMLSPYPGARSYPPGFIIFVDPDRAITNGCRVIAKLPETEEATFKVYSEDSGKRYLKPLNPQYPIIEMTESMILCGVVVGGTWEE